MIAYEFYIEATGETRKVMCQSLADAEREATRLSNYSQGDVGFKLEEGIMGYDWVLYCD